MVSNKRHGERDMDKRVGVMYTIETSITQEGDYFVAVTNPFHLTVYADTEEDAEKRANEAVDMLLERYQETPDIFTDYLNKRGVKHIVFTDKQGELRPTVRRPKYKCIRDRELELEYA